MHKKKAVSDSQMSMTSSHCEEFMSESAVPNQLSRSSIAKCTSSDSDSVWEAVEELDLSLLGLCGFLGPWLTLLVVEQLLHHKSTAESAEKQSRGGPSTKVSRRSSSMLTDRLVWLVVLMILREEKICSTRPLEKGKLNTCSHKSRRLGRQLVLGQMWRLYHTLL